MDKPQAWAKGRELGDAVREFSKQRMAQSASEGDLATWVQAYENRQLTRNVENFSWIYDMEGFDNYSIDDFVAERFTDESKQRATKEAKFAKEMYDLLQGVPEIQGKVRVTLKRFREGSSWTYRVMAILPEGTRLYIDPFLDDDKVTRETPAIMYMKADSACVNHACDVLYKELREKGGAGYIDFIHPKDLIPAMQNRGAGNEFMDPQTRETTDARLYVFASLMGYFSNQQAIRMHKPLLEKPITK